MVDRRCPICGEAALAPEQESFPFCSRRCRLVDLGNWLGEHYRVPTEEGIPDASEEQWQPEGSG